MSKSCSSCQKNKENKLVQRPRVNINNSDNSQQQVPSKTTEIASPKFQAPKVLPPLK